MTDRQTKGARPAGNRPQVQGRKVSTKADWEILLRDLREVVESNITEAEKLAAAEDLAESQETLPLIEQLEAHQPAEFLATTLEEATAWRLEMEEKERAGTLGRPFMATVATPPVSSDDTAPSSAPWKAQFEEALSMIQDIQVCPRELAMVRMREVEKVLEEMLSRDDWGDMEGGRGRVETFLKEAREFMEDLPTLLIAPGPGNEEAINTVDEEAGS